MELRKKLYQNNKGSYLIVLPKWWVEMNGLKNGDEILMKVEKIERIIIKLIENGGGKWKKEKNIEYSTMMEKE